MTNPRVTRHFIIRSKQRTGFNKKATLKFYNKAIIHGLRIESFEFRPLFFNYLKSMIKPKYYVIIYNRYIIICSNNNNTAITLLNLPRKYYSSVNSVKKMNMEEKRNDVAKHPNNKRRCQLWENN